MCFHYVFSQDWSEKEMKNFLVTTKNVNVSARIPLFSIIVFCSMDNISMVKTVLRASGYAKVDIAFHYVEDATSGEFYIKQVIENVH